MRLSEEKGLTLIELLIATVVIGIVMTGVATFAGSMKQMQGTSQTTRYTDLKLTAIMKAMRKDAELAVGDPINSGIQTNTAGSTRSICFRQDLANTPADYTDDTWACWYHHSSAPGLRRCYNINAGSVPPTNNTMCDTATKTRDFFELNDINFFTINNDTDGRLQSITLSLTAHDTRVPADPLKNPDITLKTNISPQMHSR